MISLLSWPSLEARQRAARLCMLYKLKHNLVLMTTHFTKGMPEHAFISLDKLPLKLYYSMTFFPRTVAEWNKLLPCVVPLKRRAIFYANMRANNRAVEVLRARRLRWFVHTQRATSCINTIIDMPIPGP